MPITLTKREEAEVLRKRERKARGQKLSGPKLARPKRPAADDGSAFMSWVHHDMQCIACLILGRAPRDTDIEAAHQKLNRADRGWHKRAGRRGPHWQVIPLCAFHHRSGAPCCDPAQAKFWATCGLEVDDVIDLNEALIAAFKAGAPGQPVIARFAGLAAERRAA